MRFSSTLLGPAAALGAVALLLQACAVAPAAKEPEAAPAAAPAEMPLDQAREEQALETVDEAASAFEQAEGALVASLEPGEGAAPAEAGGETLERPTSQPTQPPVATARIGDRCDQACRALGSMRRAADRLCELTGNEDPRCESVGERVARATERVRGSCPACTHAGP